jgi:ABC-type spermidine/putrescine transport system permease subunit I
MGRNEIKLRRQMMSADDIRRHQNYAALLKQHKRNQRFRRTLYVFVYSLLMTVATLLLLFAIAWLMVQ